MTMKNGSSEIMLLQFVIRQGILMRRCEVLNTCSPQPVPNDKGEMQFQQNLSCQPLV